MKSICIIFVLCAVVVAGSAMRLRRDTKYTTKYDNIDLDEILKSKRLLNNYVNCLKGKTPCTPDGTELKKNLGDALKTDCASCSETQKKGADKVLDTLLEKYPEWFTELEAIYDTEGIYRAKYAEELKKRGKALPPKKS